VFQVPLNGYIDRTIKYIGVLWFNDEDDEFDDAEEAFGSEIEIVIKYCPLWSWASSVVLHLSCPPHDQYSMIHVEGH
jgi:hypothetical protein